MESHDPMNIYFILLTILAAVISVLGFFVLPFTYGVGCVTLVIICFVLLVGFIGVL